MLRIPSARYRRRLVRPLPLALGEALAELYSERFGLALRLALGETLSEIKLDANPAGQLDQLIQLFLHGDPLDQRREIDRIFSQIHRWADKNVLRALPGIAPTVFFDRGIISALRNTQVDRINQATKAQIESVRDLLVRNQGLHSRDLTKLIEHEIGVSKNKAKLWARDQTLKFHAAVTKERHLELGIQEYYWTTVQDERVRDRHAELADRKFKYSEPPTSDSGEPINPGEDYQCRCIAFPVTPSAEILRKGPDTARIAARQARAEKILARKRAR